MPFSVIATIIIILGAFSEFTGFNLRDLFSESPIHPDITCTMEYPIKNEDDKVFRNKHNPHIVISNNGPVQALSVSGQVEVYEYDSKKDEITRFANQRMKSFRHAFSKEELKPFDEIRHPTMGMSGGNKLAIYILRVVYHVGSEMKPFDIESRFFVENKVIKDDGQSSNSRP